MLVTYGQGVLRISLDSLLCHMFTVINLKIGGQDHQDIVALLLPIHIHMHHLKAVCYIELLHLKVNL